MHFFNSELHMLVLKTEPYLCKYEALMVSKHRGFWPFAHQRQLWWRWQQGLPTSFSARRPRPRFSPRFVQVTGGRNGYGAKLTNIFSTKFVPCLKLLKLLEYEVFLIQCDAKVIECADGKRGHKYVQTWESNMGVGCSDIAVLVFEVQSLCQSMISWWLQ